MICTPVQPTNNCREQTSQKLKNELSWTLHCTKLLILRLLRLRWFYNLLKRNMQDCILLTTCYGRKLKDISVCVQRVNTRDIHFSWPPAVAQETVVVAALTRPWTHVSHVSLLCQCFSEKFDNCYRLLMHRVTLGAVRCCQWVVWMKWWW